MKIVFTFLFTLFFLGRGFAQKEKDSLSTIWHTITLADSTRFNAMHALIKTHYLYNQTDSALVLGKQMLDVAQNKKSIALQIKASTLLGAIYFERKEFAAGEAIYAKGLTLANASKDTLLYANTLMDLGELYYNYEDYTNAFKTFQKSQLIFRTLGDGLKEGWCAAYQGFIFSNLGDYKEAEKFHLEHLRLSKKYAIKRSISGANGNLGNVYHGMGNIPKSIFHWKEGIRLSKEIGLEEYASVGTSALIDIYIGLQQFEEAVTYLNEYKRVTKQFPTPKYTKNFAMHIHLWQCQIAYGLGNYNKALDEGEKSLKIVSANKWSPDSDLLKSLYEVNKKLNRPATALAYFEKYQTAIDDEKKEKAKAEIQSIVFNNQIIADSITQAQEKELLNSTYEEGLRKKNSEKNLFLFFGVLVLLVAGAYFLISRRIAAAERKRLEEINQLKNALFTNITHEFRTPLTVIKGMTAAIKLDIQNKQYTELENSATLIDRNSNVLLNLINEMLDLAKIESGAMELHIVQIDSIPFTKYLIQSFHSLAEEKNIDFSVHCTIERILMDLDVNKFTAIVTNLISNAIKFTPEQGVVTVHIDTLQENNTAFFLLSVSDSGLGISKEDQVHIFDKFYQVDNTASKLQKGTGIGLTLVKDFVALMNGSITVISTLSTGSVFRVKLPITTQGDKTDNPPLISASTSVKSNTAAHVLKTNKTANSNAKNLPLLLLIEDNMDVAHYIKTCLQENYQMLHASNGSLGIKIALEKIPDLVISDVMMPEKDGFEVCETLKTDELTDHIPIIMLTAKATFKDRLTGLSHGADAYITKPFEKEELLLRTAQLILLRNKMVRKFEKTGIDKLLSKNVKTSESKFLTKVITAIHEAITQAEFGPVQLANQLHLSESQLYRKLKATSGKSPALFVRSIRLQKGRELIETTNKTIAEIAYDVGFNDPSYFSRAFKEEFGQAPSAFSN